MRLSEMDFEQKRQLIDSLGQKNRAAGLYKLANKMAFYDADELNGTPFAKYSHLFEEGKYIVQEERKKPYVALAELALKRFGELERGQHIGVGEIKTRLGQIRVAAKSLGLDIRGYSAMNAERAWNYLMLARAKVSDIAGKVCPQELAQIKVRNAERRADGRAHL